MKKLLILVLGILFISCSSDDSNGSDNGLASFSSPILVDVANNRATIESSIVSDGGSIVTQRGIVWGTSENPTLADNVIPTDTRANTFSLIITELEAETQYFARTFATNATGTSYSLNLNFTTTQNISVVFDGGIALFSQQDVNNLAAFGYTDITEKLTIIDTGTQDIFDLTPLETLRTVGGLDINGLYLPSLDGLQNLESLGDFLKVFDTWNLTDLSALENAEMDENSTIEFIDNDALSSLNGPIFPSEVAVLTMNVNPSLQNLSNLESITKVNGALRLVNASLTSLNGLQNITTILGNLEVKSTQIGSFAGMDNLENVNGDFIIQSNSQLTSFANLTSLSNIDGNANIRFNDNLLSLEGLDNLTSISGEVRIWGNDVLQDLNGLEGLTSIGSLLWILENPSLEHIDGLSGLTSTGSFFQIIRNEGLLNLDGLANLNSVNGFFNIIDNSLLVDFCGLQPIVSNGGVDNTLAISGNAFNPSEQDIIDGNCSQ